MLHAVGNYEVNMYHDSYFHTVFWDDERETLTTKEIGSTAYGGGGSSTTLTTDESVWEKVNAYKERVYAEARAERRQKLADRYKAVRKTLKDAGVHTAFMRQYNIEELEDIAHLFGSRIRNKFKLSMREQILAWTPESKFKKPLSPKQFLYVRRPLTDMYGRPTALANQRDREDRLASVYAYEFRGLGKK